MKLLLHTLLAGLVLGLAWINVSDARPGLFPGKTPLQPEIIVKAQSKDFDQLMQVVPDFRSFLKSPSASIDTAMEKLMNASHLAHLHTDFGFGAEPEVRYFDWVVHYDDGAPDGFAKKQIMINGQSPGPTIMCNEGDTVVVRVQNRLDQGTSIHWHGLFQNSTPWMDGIAGFTQCPIPAGGSFEYNFTVKGQSGTYWYHSHTVAQYTDGLYGALIVQSPEDPYRKGEHYDEEMVILLADNYHDFADDIVRQMVSPAGYKGSPAAPSPQSGLINGRGVYDCSKATSGNCVQLKTPTADVVPGKTYRLRLINAGSHAYNYVSVDEHELEVIAVDGFAIERQRVHRVPLHNGQRTDVLVKMDQGKRGDSFLLRAFTETSCFAVMDDTFDPTANLTLQYKESFDDKVRSPKPNDWNDILDGSCRDLSDDMLIPAIPESVPNNRDPRAVGVFLTEFGFMNLSSTSRVGRFFVNEKSYTNYINRPYLETVNAGGLIDPNTISNIEFDDDIWVADIVINNNDTAIDHPYHLHGVVSHIVSRGTGIMTPDKWARERKFFNTRNPPQRDTWVIPPKSHAVIRIFADNPGVWALHCHIAFHLAGGFMGAVVIHPEAIQQLEVPQAVQDLCPVDTASLNKIEIP